MVASVERPYNLEARGFATWALYSTRPASWSLAMGGLVVLH